jgi:hypothetical protein
MRIGLATDHRGFALKDEMSSRLHAAGPARELRTIT